MKYLITGGAGFIGSHLVEKLLNKNNNIIVLDNYSTGRRENLKNFKNVNLFKCDISKKGNWFKKFKDVDCVFHIAALADIVPSINNPVKYYNSNIMSRWFSK